MTSQTVPAQPADGSAAAGRATFDSTDPELIEQVLSRSYAGLRLNLRGQHGGLRRTRAVLSPAAKLDRDRWSLSPAVTGVPLGVLAVAWLRDGHACYRSGGSQRHYGPGDVFIPAQPTQPYTAAIHHTDVEVTVLDPALLSQVAGTAPGRAPQPVQLTGHEPVSAQAAETWKATSSYVRATMLASPETAGQPLLAATMTRLLAAAALSTFPSNALADPTTGDRRDAHPATLRRAQAFIDEHAHEDITPADIAAAACVTLRTVQLAFRRHLNTTPSDYLRRVRLGHAHRDLLAASPALTTVTAIAYRWGFPSPSRFSAYYRTTYGVIPSQTLRT